MRALRILIHAPHLSGVGHHVRMRELARALGRCHAVGVFVGGRPVPGPWPGGVERLALPGLARGPRGLAPLDPAVDLATVLAARLAALRTAVATSPPDVLVIEHYPFSKWNLEPEFAALIDAARAANPRVRVACSVRDIPHQTRHEDCAPAEWATRVVARLGARFDALLVHGEAALTPLEACFPRAGDLPHAPVYTGIVAEPLPPGADIEAARRTVAGGAPFVLASIGGGSDDAGLLTRCHAAWQLLAARGATGGHRLVLCRGLAPEAVPAVAGNVVSVPFSGDFLARLAAARLSVSYAGYNTCANLLATRTRAILVPNPRMSDQGPRAAALAGLGVARTLADPSPAALAAAIAEALAAPRPVHALPLDGAERAARVLESLAG